jgi:hypothetical protein
VASQHSAYVRLQTWWSDTFAAAVRAIGHTALVLQPWHAPVPLQRSWCLWELFSTLHAGARLELLLPPAQAAELHTTLEARFDDVLLLRVRKHVCAVVGAICEVPARQQWMQR